MKPCCSSEWIRIINEYAVHEYVLLWEYALLRRIFDLWLIFHGYWNVGGRGTLDSIRLVHYYVNHKCGLWDRYVYMHVMKSKNCVTQYFGLKDKILTLMDNLYWVLSFGKEFWKRKLYKMKVVIQLCMFYREFCQIYIKFLMKNMEFEFFITKTRN